MPDKVSKGNMIEQLEQQQQLSLTRVCIKNLPPLADEIDLKEYLKENSQMEVVITDAKILKNAKGKSRKVAFVGFREAEMAKHVVDYFHKTYMKSCRINVELAMVKPTESSSNSADASGRSKKMSTQKTEDSNNNSSKDSGDIKDKDEEQLLAVQRRKEEFLQVMGGGKSKTKFWADEVDAMNSNAAEQQQQQQQQQQDSQPAANSDSDDSSGSSDSSVSDDSSSDGSDVDDTSTAIVNTKQPISDMDFLKSKRSTKSDLTEEETAAQAVKEDAENDDDDNSSVSSDSSGNSSSSSSSDSGNENHDDIDDNNDQSHPEPLTKDAPPKSTEDTNGTTFQAEEDEPFVDDVVSGKKNRLFVRNLSYDTLEEELREYFAYFGNILECHIPVDDQKRNKGFAFVAYEQESDAHAARAELDKKDFQGRLLHILPARPAPGDVSAANSTENLTWKQKQDLLRKQKETGSTDAAKGWSASFVRDDAVIDNIADRLGIKKGDLLGVKDGLDSGDAAVRLALAETQIIEENRNYFKQHGVDMEALVSLQPKDKKKAKRSNTSLLVKNLPYDTTVEELSKIFHIGNDAINILLPPSRTIALVEYSHSSTAKQAFRRLAYKRFKHVPLYLEWAPMDSKTISSSSPDTDTHEQKASAGSTAGTGGNVAATNGKSQLADDRMEASETTFDGVSASIYVKNLSFATTEDSLQKLFEKHVGGVLSVRMPKKVSPSGQSVAMGFGFIELSSHDGVQKAMKVMQGKLLDGHNIELSISKQKTNIASKSHSRQPKQLNTTKLMVRNVPFQATRKELLKLFGSFGQLRKVRLPKKFDGSHRGFAFVEYVTTKEAEAGMSALSKTHLYGRHLVIEWAADDDEDVEKLREKAGRDIDNRTEPPKNKKIRFD